MAIEQTDNKQNGNNDHAISKPDPKTLHTTDPQEHMEGPISSLVKNTGEGFEKESKDDDDDVRNS